MIRTKSRRRVSKSRSRSRKIDLTPGGIPKIIHQIWIGSDTPPRLNMLYINTCSNMDGWEHRLWKNADITKKNFPITYPYIQKIIKVGKDLGIVNKKYAQIADLMRLEILYQNGGVYIDTTAECLKNLDKLFNKQNITFAISNEDPCEFNCVNSEGEHYISNSFIASSKKNPILKKILSKKILSNIDLYSTKINKETGPYFVGRNLVKLKDDYHITMIPTKLIYPHGYKNMYRSRNAFDRCFKYSPNSKMNLELKNNHDDSIYIQYPCISYPNSFIIKHFEVGGSWK